MIHYCRYCTEAVAQSDDYAWCGYKSKMVGRTSRMNKCKGFDFCETDAFAGFRGLDFWDPKSLYKPKKEEPDNVRAIYNQAYQAGYEDGWQAKTEQVKSLLTGGWLLLGGDEENEDANADKS